MDLINKPFIIYNLKTMDSFIVLNIDNNKKYLFYYNWDNNERTIQFINESNNTKKYFVY